MLLRDLCIFLLYISLIWCDNINAISLASNSVFHGRTKHIKINYHYIREKVVRNDLAVRFVHSTNQITDVFTKGLSSHRFKLLQDKRSIRKRRVSSRGCNSQGSPLNQSVMLSTKLRNKCGALLRHLCVYVITSFERSLPTNNVCTGNTATACISACRYCYPF